MAAEVRWIDQNRDLLRLRAGITAAAMLWRNSDSQDGRLLTGALLRDATRLLKDTPEMLAPEERAFIEQSIADYRHKRRRMIYQGTAAAAAVVLAILIPVIGLQQISYGLSFARTLPSVWNGERHIPLSVGAVGNLRASIDSLGTHLRGIAGDLASRPELNAWAVAQLSLALHEPGGPQPMTGAQLRAILSQARDATCQCWRETEDKLPHSMATAWVLTALAQYDQPASIGEIQAILRRQGETGWWAMFPAMPHERNASTAATAWTAHALHRQLERNLIAPEQRERVAAAVRRASEWMIRRAERNQARWTEYPPGQIFERIDYVGVSALVIHALRTVAGANQFDAMWLDDLPRSVPSPIESEVAKGYVFSTERQFTLDDVRHYRFPWMLRTTVDAYGSGSTMQKASAAVWIEHALRKPLTPADVNNEHWTIAETLYALRHLAAALGTKPDGRAAAAGHSSK
jgi:hypothetical protein